MSTTTETATTGSASAPAYPRRAWILLVAITLLNSIGMTVVFPVLPFLTLRYVSDEASLALWVGVLEGVYALCAFLVAPLLGSLSDRIGRRPVIVIGAFGAAIGFALFGVGGGIWVLLIARIIQGLTAGDMPALFAYLADITPPEQRAKRYGLLGALAGIGMMVGPAIGGMLATISLEAPIFITAAIAATIAVVSLVALPESLRAEHRTTSLDRTKLNPVRVVLDVVRRPALRPLLLGLVLIAMPFGFFVANISVVGHDAIGWGPAQIGLLLSAVGVLDILVQGVLLGILLPRIGERGVVIAGIVTQLIGFAAIAVAASLLASPWLLAGGAVVLAAGEGGMTAALTGLLSNSVDANEQGWLAGGVSSLNSAVQIVAPLLAGVLYAVIGHGAPYWLGLVMVAVAAAVFLRAKISSPAKDATPADAPVLSAG